MADFITVQCPSCGQHLNVPPTMAGQSTRCTQCGSAVPIQPMTTPPTGYAPPMPRGMANPDVPPTTSGAAVASLICGVVCVVWPITPVAAIVLGAVGLGATNKPGVKGRGMALAGLILGSVSLIVVPIVLLLVSILLPSLNKARETANRAKCASNMHQIGLAILLYQNNYNQEYPPTLTVLAKNSTITPNVFVCPASKDTPAASNDQVESGGHCSYTYYGRGDTNPSAIDVVLSESDADHVDGVNLLFGDGHAEWMKTAMAQPMIERAKADLAYRDSHPNNRQNLTTSP